MSDDDRRGAIKRLRTNRRIVAFAGWGNGVLALFGMLEPVPHPMVYANMLACIMSFYSFARCGDWLHYHLNRLN